MSTPLSLIVVAALLVAALMMRNWRQLRRQLGHYRRLAERQGLIAESLFSELAAVRSELAWTTARHTAAEKLSSETCWDWNLNTGDFRISNSWKSALGFKDADLPSALGTLELLLHPDDRQRVLDHLQKISQSAGPSIHQLRYRLHHREGLFLSFQCRAVRMRDPDRNCDVVIAVQRPVDGGNAVASTREDAPETTAFLRDSPFLLVECEGDGAVTRVNASAEPLFRNRLRTAAQANFFDLLAPEDRDRLSRHCESQDLGTWISFHSRVTVKPDVTRLIHWTTTLRRNDTPEHLGLLSIGIELQPLPQPDPAPASHASDTDRAGLIAASLQDFRASLAAISCNARKALPDTHSSRPRQYLESIAQTSVRLQSLVEHLMTVSDAEKAGTDSGQNAFLLDQILIDSCETIRQRCREKGLQLRLRVAPEVPQNLVGDHGLLSQILTQLLDNAAKFTRQGSITFTAELGQRRGNRVKLDFAVADTGVGMDKQLAESLMKRPASSVRTLSGLSVARHLVRQLGGKITLESIPAKGARVAFSAWFGTDTEQPSDRAGFPQAIGNCRILVADAASDLCEEAATLLRHLGFRADIAIGEEAVLDKLHAAGADPYDLLFLGWNPPVFDGVALAARLRSEARDRNTLRLVIAAAAALEDVERAIGDVTVDGVLIRPLTGLHIANLIAGLFAQPAQGPVNRLMTPCNCDLGGLRFLLVEDSDTSQLIATELLHDMGGEVTAVTSGQDAWALLTSDSDRRFDAILMDLEAPELDGFETCRRIRTADRFGELPIIALTSQRRDEALPRYLAAGISDFIPKPVKPQHLYNVLAHWTRPTDARLPADGSRLPRPMPARQAVYPRLKGINIAVGLEYMSNKPELYEKVLKDFHVRFKHTALDLRNALGRCDYDYARRQTHALRNLAGSIGAGDLSTAAIELESALAEPSPPDSGVLEALEEALAEVIEGLQQQFLTD
ncbi:MAG: response regulator [Methylococcaceae bacterium]|nr:response regulator [Methylococcaceae bacterium]